jgi:hypothetical protein
LVIADQSGDILITQDFFQDCLPQLWLNTRKQGWLGFQNVFKEADLPRVRKKKPLNHKTWQSNENGKNLHEPAQESFFAAMAVFDVVMIILREKICSAPWHLDRPTIYDILVPSNHLVCPHI